MRHGTTTLFAALNVADGTLIGQCPERHRHQEWLKFLQLIDAQTPADRDLHLILDNYATHKHPKVQKWLTKHPRFHRHFTPTSASWLNGRRPRAVQRSAQPGTKALHLDGQGPEHPRQSRTRPPKADAKTTSR